MNNNSEQIGRYLQNEMTAGERIAFEKQLAGDKSLQQELFIQEQIIEAAKTAGLKNTFSKAIRRKVINTRLIQFGVVAMILVAAAFVFYAIKTNLFQGHEGGDQVTINNTGQFVINNAADTIIETNDGVVFAIPANAFESTSGKVQLEIRTAITPYDIMRQGLSTESNGSLLQTAGMFYINGYEDGKPVKLVKNIDVSVPANKVNPNMKLFDGVQDSSGNINWVNPKPVENNLQTYDITTLDFYPPNYIPVLKALYKDYMNKKYTDSLYYSFSGYYYDYPEIAPGYKTLDSTAGIEGRTQEIPGNPDTIKKPQGDSVATSIHKEYYHYEIDPSKIKAIWDKKFNNTLIATKEFEERLKYLHSLCRNGLLETYLESIDTPMHVIDQYLADNNSGSIREKFLEFAARKDGRVRVKEGMQDKLSVYFEKKYQAYREAAEKTRAKYEAELNKLNQIADEKRREQEIKDFIREDKNFDEGLTINLREAYRQIGVNIYDTTPVPPAPDYYNFPINTVGWKNLDVYVFDATTTRQSMSYTDPITGKTASLTYKEVNIAIQGQAQYDRVLVYLIPDSLSSFQRIDQQGNVFKESLNSLFRYDVVVLGYKGSQAYYHKKENLQPGQYTFSLSSIPEKELKGMLQNYSGQKSDELKTEFEYQLFNQQEIMRQVQLRKDYEFREKVAAAIFSCGEPGYWIRPNASPGSTDTTITR